MSKNIILSAKNIEVKFKVRNRVLTAIRNVSLDFEEGKVVAIVGESGSGKSVFTKTFTGMIDINGEVSNGEIIFEGKNLLDNKTEEDWLNIRGKKIATVFQDPMTSLDPTMTIGKQIMEPMLEHKHVSREEAKKRTIELLSEVGIENPEKRFKQYPHELSGGMRQRVMIAMAMVCEPELLIADEPTTALDVTVEAQILHLMRKLRDEKNTSIMMITHNLGVVAEICDTVYVMYAGQVVEHTDVYELFKNPCHPYTEGLLNSIPTVNSGERLKSIPGIVPKLDKIPKGCRFNDRCKYATERCKKEMPPLYNVGNGHTVRCFRMEEKGKEVV